MIGKYDPHLHAAHTNTSIARVDNTEKGVSNQSCAWNAMDLI